MNNAYFRCRALLLGLLATSWAAHAQIEPAAQYTTLTPAELMAWTPTGPTALPANVSTVPLAVRQNALAPQLNPAQSFSAKMNWCPDGMNNFSGYLNEQPRFNLYNFTHWQYVDVFTWFASPVGIPCRPWVETAHRNGVKIIGTVFTDRAGFLTILQKDAAGNYLGAQKLVDVANYYGFDGWFFNEESSLTTAEATELRNLLKRLQVIKPAGMEIHWYDAMLPSGSVAYQNALNANNQLLFQEGATRVSDAIFTNYFWSGPNNINTSVATANNLGRDPFDVYMGADLWPNRSNQSLFNNSAWIDNYFTAGNLAQPKLSFAAFAPNLTYNGGFNSFNTNPADYDNFYRTEQRVFDGNDLDPTTPDATGWKGFGYYLPVRSVINTLPFETYFSTGQGKVFANNGVQILKSWTDMAKQSLMPSWQWAKTGAATIAVAFDFSRAYYAGSSVRLSGSLAAGASATVKLYQTKLPIATSTNLELTFKSLAAGPSSSKVALYFSDNLAVPELLDLGTVADTLWNTRPFSLAAYAGRELAIIGVQATSATAVPAFRLNLGKLRVYSSTAASAQPTAAFTASATVVITGQPITFSNASLNATSYVWSLPGGTPASSTAVFPVVSYATAGTYAVTLQATSAAGSSSLTRTAYITVVAPGTGTGSYALLFDGVTKFVDAGTVSLSGPALSLEGWVKANSFKATSPYISSIMGMEDGGSAAMVRLGDAGLAANRLQFVLNLGGSGQNLASTTALATNTWYHVAATYDGATIKIYLNGVLDASRSATGNVVANGVFAIGRNYDNSRILNGSIDEVRAWTRALTAAEISANACQVAPAAAGLEGYWRFSEGSGPFTLDATGHGHQGTLVSMVPTDWSTNVPTQCAVTAVVPGQAVHGLQVLVLENPVPGGRAEVEIRGAQGQAVALQLCNALGAEVWRQQLPANADATRTLVPMPAAAGLYVLRVSTPSGSTTTKLLKQ